MDHADRSPEPREFKPVFAFADLQEKVPQRVAVWDEVARTEVGIVLVKQGDRVHVMGARCSHAGGPLDQGCVLGGALVCPWHGSQYDLETGQPVSGPSTCPQPRYQVRLREGMVWRSGASRSRATRLSRRKRWPALWRGSFGE